MHCHTHSSVISVSHGSCCAGAVQLFPRVWGLLSAAVVAQSAVDALAHLASCGDLPP